MIFKGYFVNLHISLLQPKSLILSLFCPQVQRNFY